eukprot:TRINITY_DN6566_c0_g1_i1.p1 TRINITY_DN6566_c0_g1~~TRINITY_DN6566_c0_g1_i1.p1  ORF type:complete len:543 (+),score=168.56 TRINITY_DN6566_c0_g1_i1:82-1710(+)
MRGAAVLAALAVCPSVSGELQRRMISLPRDIGTSTRCNIRHSQPAQGQREPTIMGGWELPDVAFQQPAFVASFGHFSQYVKNASGKPVLEDGAPRLVSTGKFLFQMVTKLSTQFISTNDHENPPFMAAVRGTYTPPTAVSHIDGVNTFTASARAAGRRWHLTSESWVGQVQGSRVWWVMPRGTDWRRYAREDPCVYLLKKNAPKGARSCVLSPGQILYIPDSWVVASCSLSDWSLAVGAQTTNFDDRLVVPFESGMAHSPAKLRAPRNIQKPADLAPLAHNRPVGKANSPLETFNAVWSALRSFGMTRTPQKVLDTGCGLGAALMWFEMKEPSWALSAYTNSEANFGFMQSKLPPHRFTVRRGSVSGADGPWDIVLAIESLSQVSNLASTLRLWSQNLRRGGMLVIVDEFLVKKEDSGDPEVQRLKDIHSASLVTATRLLAFAHVLGFVTARDKDLGKEFHIMKYNMHGRVPHSPVGRGPSSARQLRDRLLAQGKLKYRMMVLRKAKEPGQAIRDVADRAHELHRERDAEEARRAAMARRGD